MPGTINIELDKYRSNGYDLEFVSFRALADENLRPYALCDATYTDAGELSGKMLHFYKFPAIDVKRDDRIVVNTRPGTYHSQPNPDGTTTHELFMGSMKPIWNDAGDKVTVMFISDWDPYTLMGSTV